MRVNLDNCCYNRPFDDQTQLKVRLETEAKLFVQQLMRTGAVEYVWSDMLDKEALDNPFPMQRVKIMAWKSGAKIDVEITPEIVIDATALVNIGLGNADAIHLACASAVDCDWFLTTDIGILKKVRQHGLTRVANPVEFAVEVQNAN